MAFHVQIHAGALVGGGGGGGGERYQNAQKQYIIKTY